MNSNPRSPTAQRLLEYVHLRSVGPLESASIVELTATVQSAIEAELPGTLTTLLRELGRRGGLRVSVEAAGEPPRRRVRAPPMQTRA